MRLIEESSLWVKQMGDVIDLKTASLIEDHGFVVDLARFRENLLDEKAIRKKYRLANDIWEKLGEDDLLIRKVEEESVRRIRDGSCKRERAQALVVKAPEVAASIMNDVEANARHRLDAYKVLDDFSANGPAGAPAADRFQITIVLNTDVERYDKSIEVNPNDIDPHHSNDRPMIAAKKKDDDQW